MNPIKLLHITGDSRFGGAGRIILGLGQVARAEGWQVEVLTTDEVFQRAAVQHGLGVVDLDVIRREIRPIWDVAGLARLSHFLRRGRYDVVHTHTSKAGFVGRLAARLAHVPVILHTAHGFAFHECSPRRVRVFYSTLERAAARWCDRIVSVSNFHRSWALELGICDPAQIVAIPNGIAPLPKPALGRLELRQKLGARSSDLLILTMARLAADKGLEYLVDAAALLARYDRRFLVAIAGEGPERASLEQQSRRLGVTDRVIFLGFRQDVTELLEAADVVVLPSLREGLSIALLEAMAAAKPIIATSIGSQREIVSQDTIAWLVPPADAAALSDAIFRLARDPIMMAHLATRARGLFDRQYTEKRMLSAYKDLYFELIARKCPSEAAVKLRADLMRYPDIQGEFRMVQAIPKAPGSQFSASRSSGVDVDGRRDHSERLVRKATDVDLLAIVRIHQKAFGNFFLTRLGADFLLRYYELVLNYRSGIILVSERLGSLQGFTCGFVDPAEFYRLMWRSRRGFVLPVLTGLFRDPSLATGILQGVQRIQTSASLESPKSCELSSIAVAPEASGNGLGRALIRAFITQARAMDAECVYLTTDAENNEPANALYQQAGFRRTRRFLQRKGRWMNEYIMNQLELMEASGWLHD